MGRSEIPRIVKRHESEILAAWLVLQQGATRSTTGSTAPGRLQADSAEFLRRLAAAAEGGDLNAAAGADWEGVRDFLAELSRSRARQGFTTTETAMFIFSLKQPLFDRLRTEIAEPASLAQEIVAASNLLDQLGLYTAETYQRGREEIINRQQQELLELSTPVMRLWEGVLAVPLIGTLDSARTQIVMESLLTEVVNTGASIAVIDITGVPTVDTVVAQHLLKTVAAAQLMGAQCIISGIRPQIAQTIVHLGVQLGDVTTKSTLADAFRHALRLRGLSVRAEADQHG